MRVVLVAVWIMAAGLNGLEALATPPDSPGDSNPTYLGQPRPDLLYIAQPQVIEHESSFRFDLQYDLLSRPDIGPRLVELNYFETVVFAADRGAHLGLMLGGAGSLLGLWSEETALAIMGVGAALGTAYGVTAGSDDPSLQYRLDWGDENRYSIGIGVDK